MGKKHYRDKKKKLNKAGSIDAGKGKVRPHHKEIAKRVNKYFEDPSTGQKTKIGKDRYKKRLEDENNNYIPRTPNKYQTTPKRTAEDANSYTYEWFEDNGHKDHIQHKKKTVLKDEESRAGTFSTITNEKYQNNYKEIFGDKKRGVECKGGYKKFKKTY